MSRPLPNTASSRPKPSPRPGALPWRVAALLLLPLVALPLAVLHGAGTAQAEVPAQAEPFRWQVAPDGVGDCASTPCASIDAAYQLAQPGDVIELAEGAYPDQVIAARALTGPNITARPAAGATVSLGAVRVDAERLTLQGFTLSSVTLRPSAHGSGVDRSVFTSPRQALTMMGATGLFLQHSRLTGGYDADRVQVQGAVDARIEGNLIGGTGLSPGSASHVDCLQVLAADGLVVRGNVIFGCAGQTIFVQRTFGPVQRVLFDRNWVQDCVVRDPACNAYFAVHVQTPGTTWVGNTIAGAFYLKAGNPGTFRDNIIGSLLFDHSQLAGLCTGSVLEHNLMQSNCPPGMVDTAPNHDNTLGSAAFVGDLAGRPDPAFGPDLRLAAASLGTDLGSPFAFAPGLPAANGPELPPKG